MADKTELTIVVRDGKGKETTHKFTSNQIRIGRNSDSEIPLSDPTAGKEHALIEVSEQGTVRVVDLGTSTGTQLNGNRVEQSNLVSDGDKLRIGETQLTIRVKGQAATGAVKNRWAAYELPHKPVLNIAQIWEENVVAVNRFGKSARHIIHSVVYSALLLSFQVWFTLAMYGKMREMYADGKLDDYGPAMTAVIACFIVADIVIFMMTREIFKWPRESQFKTVTVGQDTTADFFVPEDMLGQRKYPLIVSYKGKPVLNLEKNTVQGKVMINDQVLSVDKVKQTSLIKEKYLLPLTYKIKARIEVGDVIFILGLEPAMIEPKGAFLSRINIPILASFLVAFFIHSLFLLAVMAAPKSEPVKRISSLRSRSFKTLIRAEKQKKEKEKEEKKDLVKVEDEEKKKLDNEEEELQDEVDKVPVLEQKKQEEKKTVVVKKTQVIKQAKKAEMKTDLKHTKTKKKYAPMSSLSKAERKERVRSKGALAAIHSTGMKVMGSDFGDQMKFDNGFQAQNDLALEELGSDGALDVGATGSDDPFNLSEMESDGNVAGGDPTAGGSFGGSVGADGTLVGGNGANIGGGTEIKELSKKRVAKAVKGPKFKDKKVRIAPSPDFGMEGSGKLDKAVVKRYIRKQINKIRWCYQSAFQRNPDLEGKMTVQFIISPTGSVMRAKVLASTMGDSELARCVERKIQTWKFPAPKGGGVVKVNYPFVFRKQ